MKIKYRRYFFYYLLRVGVFLVGLLPARVTYLLGRAAGMIIYYLLGHFRRRTLENLRAAFPSKSEKEIIKIAKNAYANVIGNFAELIHIRKLKKNNIDSLLTVYGQEELDKALSRGKGVIGLTAHFGNWELIGPSMKIKGYDGISLARKLYFYKYDNLVKRLREASGTKTIDRDESPKKILRVLRDNKILGMLADQDIDNIEGVFVNFFEKPAYTPTAPVKLAMVSGAPIVPCYMIRNGFKFECFIGKPIYVKSGEDREAAVKHYTQEWTSVLESYIRKYPDQWVWMHRRWKTKPPGEK